LWIFAYFWVVLGFLRIFGFFLEYTNISRNLIIFFDILEVFRIFGVFFRIFGNISENFGFFFYFEKRVFGHPGSIGKTDIREDFSFLRIFLYFWEFSGLFKNNTKNLWNFWIIQNLATPWTNWDFRKFLGFLRIFRNFESFFSTLRFSCSVSTPHLDVTKKKCFLHFLMHRDVVLKKVVLRILLINWTELRKKKLRFFHLFFDVQTGNLLKNIQRNFFQVLNFFSFVLSYNLVI
jgi:hypothetical protein